MKLKGLSRCPLVSALLGEFTDIYFSGWKRDGTTLYLDKNSNSDILSQLLNGPHDCECDALLQINNKYGGPGTRTKKYKIHFFGTDTGNRTDKKGVCDGTLDGMIREEINEEDIERLKKELRCEKVLTYV
jgi:hypothetical protein